MTDIAVLQMTAEIDPAANADTLERAIAASRVMLKAMTCSSCM